MTQTAFDVFDNNEDDLERYLGSWRLHHYFMQMKQAREANDRRGLIRAANAAWVALPDRAAIREYAFFRLCDIAEEIFE